MIGELSRTDVRLLVPQMDEMKERTNGQTMHV